MAKLSARGRYQIVEATREYDEAYLLARHEARRIQDYGAGQDRCAYCHAVFPLADRAQTVCTGTPDGYQANIGLPHLPTHGEKPLTCWERVTRRLMSDRTVLEKRDVRFYPDAKPYPGEEKGRYRISTGDCAKTGLRHRTP